MTIQAQMVHRLHHYSKIASLIVTGLGLAVLLGWLVDLPWQTRLFPDFPPMKFNTALCFVLSGLTLTALYHRPTPRQRQLVAQLGGSLVLLIASLTTAEIIFQRNFGIDELVVNDPAHTAGRMAPLSAVFFLLIGLALLLLNDHPQPLVQLCGLMALVAGLFGVVEFIFSIDIAEHVSTFSAVPPVTMVSYMLLTTALLAYRLDQSPLRIIVSDTTGGFVLRRLLLGMALVAIISNWLELYGVQLGWYPDTFARALFVITPVLIMGGFIWRIAQWINRVEAERNAAHTTMSERELLYRTLFEGVDDTILVHDLEGHILEINESSVRRLGYSREELLRMRTIDLDVPDYAAKFPERLASQLQYGRLDNIIGTHVAKNGRKIPIQVSTRVIPYKGGQAVLAVAHDISLLQKAQQDELDLAMERARSAILTKFLQDASHEFRTPLAIMMMNLSTLARVENARRELLVNSIEDQINRMTKLVDQLVMMTALDDSDAYHMEPTSLPLLFDHLSKCYAPEHTQRTVDFQLGLEAPTPMLNADLDKLQNALRQIIDNALRFSPPTSPVLVYGDVTPTSVIISVTDQGAGIDPAEFNRIFMRFYRQDKAHTTEGFGLGLAIAKAIIKAHQGSIEVESEVGRGSTFRVILPLEN